MNVTIEPVSNRDGILTVAQLAREIWTQHYMSIIGPHQINYMLERFQSAEAIQAQLADRFEYHIARQNGVPVGYIGLIPNEPTGKMMLSKIYVKDTARGAGVGNALLALTKKRAADTGAGTVWLTVNRHNERTIGWYKGKGFSIADTVKKDIGSGYYMDDFIMECTLD
ncbi:MAG: GNAT family N-acetyltransferase [Pontiellaceae bacterium]|nr:GNAT family N-acetyltransferase [Pontiellaceae bacterium]MBN2784098.1 GNAT family N-acetyltransferase [Pontiellaceae bacterium]